MTRHKVHLNIIHEAAGWDYWFYRRETRATIIYGDGLVVPTDRKAYVGPSYVTKEISTLELLLIFGVDKSND